MAHALFFVLGFSLVRAPSVVDASTAPSAPFSSKGSVTFSTSSPMLTSEFIGTREK
jgi:hypothetical protein